MSKNKTTSINSYILKNGEKRFMFKIYVGIDPLTGNESYTTRRCKTLGEAKTELARLKMQINDGTFRKKQVETYHDIYKLWVSHYETTVEESTFVKTIGIFKNHILPAMGTYKIEKINVEVCQKHVNEWKNKLKNFRMVKAYASKVLDFAIRYDYIQKNPFSLVEIANNRKQAVSGSEDAVENFYTKEQLTEFLNCLEKENNYQAYALFRLLAYSGIRKGEALALSWNDLNFTTNELRINKAISRGKDNKLYLKSTKTGIVRTIKMDDKTMEIMKEWKRIQKQDYLVLGFNTLKSGQLVFSNKANKYLQPTKTRKWIQLVQKKYKLSTITTHGLRHTHCSLLFEAGVSLKDVQDRLGHSDVQTTLNIYTHVTQKTKEEAIQKFESYLNS
ncbi:tyrosine-type recombinase/integrase [Lysinibacillus xylanilyticus]|uniref:Tyrosine-type recombinase/integrase n=1 Tax=Lysinibacillus xylanilyticus TaxID=582475 RepID=A0ABV3W0A6_9BACI